MRQAVPEQRSPLEHVSYEGLYKLWETGQWSAYELDFTQDRVDWHETFGPVERRAAAWNYSMFYHGEDVVIYALSPYIEAAPLIEQKYFLTTQQVDEARHAVLFKRFMEEVVEVGGGSADATLEATRPELTWGFKKTFGYLDTIGDSLKKDPSVPNFAAAIFMYHFLIEATIAQTGQHFIIDYLGGPGLMPGFREGVSNVARDEQRHIAFGVKCVSDLVKQDPDCKHAIADLMRTTMPYVTAVFVPPNWDRGYTEVFGETLEDLLEKGMNSLEQKMRAAGLPLEELPGAAPVPRGLTARERADRTIQMLQAGYLGEKTGPPDKDPQRMEVLFDLIRRSIDTTATPSGGPATIAWEFPDAPPFFMRIANGSTEARPGRLEDPDLTLRCRFEDWVDIVAGRRDPRVALATGRLRPRGSLRLLFRMGKLFGR